MKRTQFFAAFVALYRTTLAGGVVVFSNGLTRGVCFVAASLSSAFYLWRLLARGILGRMAVLALALAFSLGDVTSVFATMVPFGATRGVTIIGPDDGSDIANWESAAAMFIGSGTTVNVHVNRSIVAFDGLGSLSGAYNPGNGITGITLKGYLKDAGGVSDGSPFQSNLHNISGAYAADATWVDTEATWNNRKQPPTSVAWDSGEGLASVAGSAALASLTVGNYTLNDPYTFSFSGTPTQLTALVDGWLSNGSKASFLFTEGSSSVANKYIAFYDEAGGSLKPVLEITYNPVPEPGSLALLLLGSLMLGRLGRRRKA